MNERDSRNRCDEPEILIVDDEPGLAQLFAVWLEDDWNVEAVDNGTQALEKMSDSIELVLLDRRMPGVTGDDVLEAIRTRDYDCRVVMVTAVDPDFDILEMGFDDYLVKPISREELCQVVDEVVTRNEYQAEVKEYFSLVSKKSLLESEKSPSVLEATDEYHRLCDRIETLDMQLEKSVETMSHDDFVGAFEDVRSGL